MILRFNVRRRTHAGRRRGGAFIKEIVPRRAIAWAARIFYKEDYFTLLNSQQVQVEKGISFSASYAWEISEHEIALTDSAREAVQPRRPGTEEEFIADRYWGYFCHRDGSTLEYQVKHPSWRMQEVASVKIESDLETCYGQFFARVLRQPPAPALLAEGSRVIVRKGAQLE